MPTTKENFAFVIQQALPEARVFWTKAPSPYPFPHDQSCSLTAESLTDPNKKFTMNMPNGLGYEPLDDVVAMFVERFKES